MAFTPHSDAAFDVCFENLLVGSMPFPQRVIVYTRLTTAQVALS